MSRLARREPRIDRDVGRQGCACRRPGPRRRRQIPKPRRRRRPRGRRTPARAACRSDSSADRVLGKHSHGQHQVLEVEAGGRDLDLDLVGLGRRARERRAPTANSRIPGRCNSMRNGCDGRLGLPAQSMHRGRGDRHQAVHVSQLAVQRDLILRVVRRRSILRPATRSPRRSRSPDRPAGSAGSGIR